MATFLPDIPLHRMPERKVHGYYLSTGRILDVHPSRFCTTDAGSNPPLRTADRTRTGRLCVTALFDTIPLLYTYIF